VVEEALANASGVSRSMLSQIEREEANPTLAVTLRIARAFGCSGNLLQLLHFRCLHPPRPRLRSAGADGSAPVIPWTHPGEGPM
jgi:transcriptional regulator with XRE-family HTH domain